MKPGVAPRPALLGRGVDFTVRVASCENGGRPALRWAPPCGSFCASAVSGIVYAFFAGQPLCIMGATGPELAYTLVFYEICKSLDIEVMAARFWCGMWCALISLGGSAAGFEAT